MQIEIGRLLVMHAAWKLDQGDLARKEVSMAKIHVADTLHQAADAAIQLNGARGYSKDTVLEWIYRYARAGAAGRRRRRGAQDGAGRASCARGERFLALGRAGTVENRRPSQRPRLSSRKPDPSPRLSEELPRGTGFRGDVRRREGRRWA